MRNMASFRSLLNQRRSASTSSPSSTHLQWLETEIKEKRVTLISHKKFTDFDVSNTGGNGSVQSAYWAARDLRVGLKSVFNIGSGSKAYAELKGEVEMLLKVGNGKGVIPFLGLTQDRVTSQYMMVFQLADSGNLEDYLQRNGDKMEWRERIHLAVGVAEGLAHIHAQDVLHKDLHSKNVLIHEQRAVIADFGCSRMIDYDGTRTDAVGRYAFCAPEKLEGRKGHVYDKSCDVYSLGVILWHISSGRAPFSEIPQWRIVGMVCNGEREKPSPGTPDAYAHIYTECWDKDPEVRPKTDSVLSRLRNLWLLLLHDHTILIGHWISGNEHLPPSYTWTLLYRGSRDGFSVSDFHRCCDGKGPAVTIIKPNGLDRLIGGFNSKGWKSPLYISPYSKAPGSFIFSIGKSVDDTFISRLRNENSDYAIVNYRSVGPFFGLGDLWIINDCNQNSLSYCKSTIYDRQLMDDMEKDEKGRVKFKVDDYEVYGVK